MLLIIDNYDSFTYNLYQMIATLHQDVCVARNDKLRVGEVRDLHPLGIILSPGPGRPEDAGICVDLVRAVVELGSPPLLGVCLGHQAITLALGGRVVPSKNISHGKEDDVYNTQTGLYQKMTQPFKAGRYHSLMAERDTLPSSLIIEAENHQQVIMGLRHIKLPIYGVQFHPESILTPQGQVLLQNFVAICTAHREAA